jgi:cytochrome bd-type quinol oxidase subunit 2
MKPEPERKRDRPRLATLIFRVGLLALLLACAPARAYAMEHDSETIDTIADVLTWVVLVVAPVVGIAVFLLIHILPEKIAEKKQHPQTSAIQCLCLLSLVFGGMLWPLAWLWAYTKPVLYRMAYGTDAVPHGDAGGAHSGELEAQTEGKTSHEAGKA